mmetsp:Transcript_75910/g.210716  ORF Transcript_75910/g.210716 Transcript_75910/m.210716 type:complete len:451 (+) Transcript_75910:69-1421(+)
MDALEEVLKAKTKKAIEAKRRASLFVSLAPEDNLKVKIHDDVSGWQQYFVNIVQSTFFSATTLCAILANTFIIACECEDFRKGVMHASYYYKLELMFTTYYCVELLLRMIAFGSSFFSTGWNWFDIIICAISALDALGGLILHKHVSLSVVRLLRILRLMRIFRIMRFVKDLEYTLVSAWGALPKVVVSVIMIDFIGAVVLTQLFHDTTDEVIAEMFGKLSNSMFHLFRVMVDGMSATCVTQKTDFSGGVVVITDKTMKIYPSMWIFWVVYIFFGNITLMALVPAIFVELSINEMLAKQKEARNTGWEVQNRAHMLECVFACADVDGSQTVNRTEFANFLVQRGVLDKLRETVEELASTEDDPEIAQQILLDAKNLCTDFTMDFTMVFDAMEALGKYDLTAPEFRAMLKQLRAKPLDQMVHCLQQEVFKLRAHLIKELQGVHPATLKCNQ